MLIHYGVLPKFKELHRDTLKFVEQIIIREVNAATDNPLIFDPGVALSGGNFHGEPDRHCNGFFEHCDF